MISTYQLKTRFQRLLQPLLAALYRMGATPNHVTVSAILLSLALGICLWNVTVFQHALWLVPIGFLVRMALNALDGMMAVTYKMQSKAGEMLNELGDVISDLFVFIPLMMLPGVRPLTVMVFVSLALVNEFAGVMGKILSGTRRYDGPMGKSDRALTVGLMLLLSFFIPAISTYYEVVLAIASLLMCFSTFVRIRKSLSHGGV